MRDPVAMQALTMGRSEGLRDEVYRAVRRQISHGRLRPGARLTETTVAAALRVSRTPVREGLAALAREGLLVRHGRSFAVPSLNQNDIDEVFELRCLLEPHAIQRVTEAAREAELAELIAALRDQKTAHAAGDAERFIAANARFRHVLIGIVPNRRLRRAIALYNDHLSFLRVSFDDPRWRTVILKNFDLLVRAMRRRDPVAAGKVWRQHLSEGADAVAREWLRQMNGRTLDMAPPRGTSPGNRSRWDGMTGNGGKGPRRIANGRAGSAKVARLHGRNRQRRPATV